MKKKILSILALIIAVGGLSLSAFNMSTFDYGFASAANVDKDQCTSILPKSWCDNKDAPTKILNLVLYVITAGVGVVALAGVIITGVQYASARDDEGQVIAAKERMRNITIGLFLWAAMFALIKWLVVGEM